MKAPEEEIMDISQDHCGGDSEQTALSSIHDRESGIDNATATTGAADCNLAVSSVEAELAGPRPTNADLEILQLLASRRSRLLSPSRDHHNLSSLPQSLPYDSSHLTGKEDLTLTNTLPSSASTHRMLHNMIQHTPTSTALSRAIVQNYCLHNDFLDQQQQVLFQHYQDNPFRNSDFFLGRNQCRNRDLGSVLSQYYDNQYRDSTNMNNNDATHRVSSLFGRGHGYYPSSEFASLMATHSDRYLPSVRDILLRGSSSATATTSHANILLLGTRQPYHDFNNSNPFSQASFGRRYNDASGNCANTAPPSSSQPQYSNVSSATSSTSTLNPPSISSTASTTTCFYPHDLTNSARHPTSLVINSDSTFLDPVHIFLRRSCIEIFTTTRESMMSQPRGARASKVGQVGLRCIWCKNEHSTKLTTQAICFPSKRETIFDSVRNYQRKHIDACPCIPEQAKDTYKRLLLANVPHNKSQRLLKAYYAEAASELGIVDSPKGLIFGAQPNMSDSPSENLQAILQAAESPDTSADFWKNYKALSAKDKSISLRKFDHLVSEGSREVIMKAKKDTSSSLVCSQDFPKVGDVEFLLYKQVIPFKPSLAFLERRHIDPEEFGNLNGICCKFCAHVNKGGSNYSGVYLPTSFSTFADFSFTQSLLSHIMACRNVPRELKDTFDELKHLASEHCVVAKRGSIKKFLEKVWERLQSLDSG